MALAECNEEGGLIWSDIKKENDYPHNNNNLICFLLIDCVGKLKCIKKKCDTEGELGSFCSAHAQCR